ncbi:MAG: ATP-binding cassette domain-containing protein, partial [Burkholderiales bacterium]
MPEALALEGVSAGYGATHVLEGVNLALAKGESLSVIGRNGVGKSTLLATIMGHTSLHAGSIRLGGRALERAPAHQRARAGLAYVPQEREIFASLTVRENLELGARRGRWDLERVCGLFPNLAERLGHGGAQLSGGEQ